MRLIRSFDWSSRNRTRIRWANEGHGYWFIVLERGNGNSDPVWSIGLEGTRRRR